MRNEELFHQASRGLTSSLEALHDMNESKIGINDGIALACRTCQSAMTALQELKNRSEGVEPPKQG